MMKSKRIIPILIILILSLFPIPPFVESAGYGEENENLGQFTDDFENDDNVSVAVNVINNQTLDCMELSVSPSPTYYNISNFVEVDPANRYSQTDEVSTWTGIRRGDVDSRLVGDMGVDYFKDSFSLYTEFNLTDAEAGDASWRTYLLALGLLNHGTNYDTNRRIIFYCNQRQVAPANDALYEFFMQTRTTAGVSSTDTSIAMTVGVNYYLNLTRYNSGDSVRLTIKTGSHTGAIHDTLQTTIVTFGGEFLRYVYAPAMKQNANDPNDETAGTISRFSESVGGGYFPNGYFTTEDYLNYTTGQGLALLTNASIPYDTSITVQFSNDNATWVDNEGNVGSTPVLDGFYAIDLRDLNYTDSFKMYNLSTSDSMITPRLFQSRLVTTNGTAGAGPVGPGPTVIQNVTGEWFYYNLTTINVTVGVHDSGDLNSTLDIDGDTYNCSEVVGAPGYVIEFEWTDVDLDAHCLWVCAYIFYDGVSAHTINVDLWNFTSTAWVTIGIIYDMVDFEWVNSSIYDLRMPNDFINSTGAVRGRFYHSSAGNINDDIHTDFLKLYAFIPSDVVTPIISEDNFFWVFIAIVLSIITALLVWMKYGDNNN